MQQIVTAYALPTDSLPAVSNPTTMQHTESMVYEHYMSDRDPWVYKVPALCGGSVHVIAFRHFENTDSVAGFHEVYTPPVPADDPCDCC